MALTVFLDTSVLLAGLIDFGPQSAPSQRILHALVDGSLKSAGTAWHCCLEFYSVATRLPPEYRLRPPEALQLVEEVVLPNATVLDLPSAERLAMLERAAEENVAGGRVYDAHIAEIARAAGAAVIVTDNRRHFVAALRYGIRVETPAEFVAALKRPK
jgi:predicted nucleic acid-binding protein